MAGNAGNGTQTPQPVGVIISTGAQMLTPTTEPESAQNPGTPTAVGSFNISQLSDKTDKIGKDTNFRGLTIFNNVLYYTKGSGGNGVNTVYFVDTTGTVCTDTNGVGLPVAGASLPTSPLAYNPDPTVIQTDGLQPDNMCILKGLPTVLAKAKPPAVINFPFGIWFANATTLYVADEGSGTAGTTVADFYTPATPAQNPTAGLQKWIFNSSAGEWQLAYTLTNGLNLGVPYNVRWLSHREQFRTRRVESSVGAGHRRPSQYHGRDFGWDRDHLRDHLHHQRERRSGRRSEQAGRDHG